MEFLITIKIIKRDNNIYFILTFPVFKLSVNDMNVTGREKVLTRQIIFFSENCNAIYFLFGAKEIQINSFY